MGAQEGLPGPQLRGSIFVAGVAKGCEGLVLGIIDQDVAVGSRTRSAYVAAGVVHVTIVTGTRNRMGNGLTCSPAVSYAVCI